MVAISVGLDYLCQAIFAGGMRRVAHFSENLYSLYHLFFFVGHQWDTIQLTFYLVISSKFVYIGR